MYALLGSLNIFLILVVTSPYWLRKINEWFVHSKSERFAKLLRALRVLHKPLALLLLACMAVHGYLALGGFRLHTGTLAGLSFLLTTLLGLVFYLAKKPVLYSLHRGLAAVSALLTVVHLLAPNLLFSMGL